MSPLLSAPVLGALLGCAGSPAHTVDPVAPTEPGPTATTGVAAVTAPTPTPQTPATTAAAGATTTSNAAASNAAASTMPAGAFDDAARSVRFVANTVLYAAPSVVADKAGLVRKDTRAGVIEVAPGGDGCDEAGARWIHVAPRGWACETQISASSELPTTATPVALGDPLGDDVPLVPGVYGTVRRSAHAMAFDSVEDARAGAGRALVGTTSVRAQGSVTVDGVRYWRTAHGLIPTHAIARFSPSEFHGVVIDDPAAMPVWVRSHHDPKAPVATREAPRAKARVRGTLAPRTVVTIRETSPDGAFVRVDDDAWIARDDLRVAQQVAPPPGTAADEKWFDVDLDEQVLVAYEGERPVYATLVSTGKREHRTPTVITRIASKLERATMNSDATEAEVYSVADVPWTMYYDKSFALHTSYWHDGFGGTRSHGCINLAPRDARALYHWSSPDIPPGWIAVYGDADHPGSLVRVRSRRTPSPPFRGYARTLHERATLVAL